MLSLFDVPSLERALSLPLDPKLRHLLHGHVKHMSESDPHVAHDTLYLIVGPGATEADITDEIGMVPTCNPLDGVHVGSEAFHPFHDHLVDRGGWFELIVSAGNDAAFVLLIQDHDELDPRLLDYCQTYAA